jgi:DNA repair exonuclease SbcCD nuclease subunit
MTRLLHWSDLHNEFGAFDLPDIPKDIEGLLLAGDTGVGRGHLDFLWQAWEAYGIPIVSIHGNHEYYNSSFESLLSYERKRLEEMRKSGADIRVLHGDTTRVGDAVIFGATLWTDYGLYPGQEYRAKRAAEQIMRDFSAIKLSFQGEALKADHILERHHADRSRLIDAMAHHRDDKLVVMTHHMPLEACVAPQYRGDLLNAAFSSNLLPEIMEYGPDFWVYGHSHNALELDIPTDHGITRLRHNPRGYPTEDAPFNPMRIIDTENPETVSA